VSLLQSPYLHSLYEGNRAHLIGAHLLALVATDTLPDVRVFGRLLVTQAVIYVGVLWVELGVVLGRAPVFRDCTADSAL